MRRVVMFNRVTLDGLYAGPNGEIDWFIPDPEADKAVHQAAHADTLLMGRVTYQLFESVWPQMGKDPAVPAEAKVTARELDEMEKVVFSRTLGKLTWDNSRLAQHNPPDEMRMLKQGSGADIIMFGSGTIVQQLTAEGLIDEYLLLVTPVILGAGKALFEGVRGPQLRLAEVQSFRSGNALLHYSV